MKLIFEAFSRKLEINMNDDMTVDEFLEEILVLFNVAGYGQESIGDAILDLAEEIKIFELYYQRKDSDTVNYDKVCDELKQNTHNYKETCEKCCCDDTVLVTDYSCNNCECKEFKFVDND